MAYDSFPDVDASTLHQSACSKLKAWFGGALTEVTLHSALDPTKAPYIEVKVPTSSQGVVSAIEEITRDACKFDPRVDIRWAPLL